MSNFSASIMDDIKRGSTTTLAIGMGVLALVPAVLPVVAQGIRPLIRGTIRGGLVCLEKGQEAVSEIRGVLEDVANQAKAETSGHRNHGHASSYGHSQSSSSSFNSSSIHTPGPTQAYAASTPAGSTTVPMARRPPPPDQKLEPTTGEPDPEFMG